jgi:hypothetical protein
MTTTHAQTAPTRTAHDPLPGRRLLVGLALVYLAFFAALMATGADRSADDDPAKLIADYDIGDVAIQLVVYGAVAAGAVLVFFGSALRARLVARTRRWTADVAMLGFVVMGLTIVGFAMTALALHHAVEIGNTTVVQAINVLDTTNFPIAMLALTCAMVGTGITALREQLLPRWLCWVSIALGVMAPLGELAFAPFVLFPVWTVVVAGTIHLSERDTVLAADGADR